MTRHHATAQGNVPFTAEEEVEFDAAEIAWNNGTSDRLAEKERRKRDGLLAKTDWRTSSDLTLSTEWATYRQALRDVPQQTDFPSSITWPTKP
tara:strand:+ start:2206 stop:2484 length:279 start_codon:yes stop_codon:yes gene_type:complete